MYVYKCLCDRCKKVIENKSHGIPPGWFSVLAFSKNNQRETVSGDSENRRHICPECIMAELASFVADVSKGVNYDFAHIELRREPPINEEVAT